MAKCIFIEDYQRTSDLIEELSKHSTEIVVLASKKLLKAKRIKMSSFNALIGTYDCGGEPDIWMDIVTKPDHYLFTHLKEHKHG